MLKRGLRRRQAERRLPAADQGPASSTTCSSTRIPGVNEETLLSIAISDKLLLVMRPDSQDFQGTAVTVELARRLEIPEMLIVVNKVPPGHGHGAAPRAASKRPTARKSRRMLPLNSEMVRLASSGIFANRYPDHPMTLALKQVAERVMALIAASPTCLRTVTTQRSTLAANHVRHDSTGALDALLGGLKSAVAPFRETLNELHAKYRGNMRRQGRRLHSRAGQGRPRIGSASPSSPSTARSSTSATTSNSSASSRSPSRSCSGWRSRTTAASAVLEKVGVEPTGEAFNAIVLDEASNRPFNPMVNAGAIATADLIQGKDFADRIKRHAGHVRPLHRPRSSTSTTRSSCPSGPPAIATGPSPT